MDRPLHVFELGPKLTDRQIRLIKLCVADRSVRQAATEMKLPVSTAYKDVQAVKGALDTVTWHGAIAKALLSGLLEA